MSYELVHDISLIVFILGTLWLLVLIFKESVAQGVITMWLLPLIYMYIKMNWRKSRIPFGLHILGAAFLVYGQIADPFFDSKTQILSSSDGSASIILPKNWRKLRNLDKDAIIQAGYPGKNKYLVVYSITKDEMQGSTISDFASGFAEGLKSTIPDAEIGNINLLKVNGIDTLQRVAQATENNRRISYLYNILDYSENYYVMLFWTMESNFENTKSEMTNVLNSFKTGSSTTIASNE